MEEGTAAAREWLGGDYGGTLKEAIVDAVMEGFPDVWDGDDITAWPNEHACSPPGYGDPEFAAPRMIIRCRLRSPEAYQACLDVADVGGWKDGDEVCGRSGHG